VRVFYTSKFEKKYKKLPSNIKIQFLSKLDTFKNKFDDPSLKTHQLFGNLVGHYAFSVNYQYRVIFVLEKNGATFLNIGTHEIYK